jgi:alpha-beta hydrolase superfamily lysophospholipase
MPGWFFPAPGDGPKPTLVAVNGADGALSYLNPGHGSEAAARGYNVVLFDGPGQQSMLFERGIPFRPDWEHVVEPVVDVVLRRPDVDPRRLALYAVSQGGYWAPRALAFEHRFAAAVIDGGVVDVPAAWNARLTPELEAMLADGERDRFNAALELAPADTKRVLAWRAKPYGCPTLFDTYREVQRYRITPELAARITTPVLVADPDDEQYFAGQPRRLYDMLTCEKRLVRFTAAEGAAGHCQPMARGLAAQRFFDFLDDHVGLTAS